MIRRHPGWAMKASLSLPFFILRVKGDMDNPLPADPYPSACGCAPLHISPRLLQPAGRSIRQSRLTASSLPLPPEGGTGVNPRLVTRHETDSWRITASKVAHNPLPFLWLL